MKEKKKELNKFIYLTTFYQMSIATGISSISLIAFSLKHLEFGNKNPILFLMLSSLAIIFGIIITIVFKKIVLNGLLSDEINEKQARKASYLPVVDMIIGMFMWIVGANIIVSLPFFMIYKNSFDSLFFSESIMINGIAAGAIFFTVSEYKFNTLINSDTFQSILKYKMKLWGVKISKKLPLINLSIVAYPALMIGLFIYYIEVKGIKISNVKTIFLIIVFQTIIISSILTYIITRYISKNVNFIGRASDKLMVGDSNIDLIHGTDEMGIISNQILQISEYLNKKSLDINKIANGDIEQLTEVLSENDLLSKSMNNMITILNSLIDEIKKTSKEAKEGDLCIRGDFEKYSGAYKEIVESFNIALDRMLDPINEAIIVIHDLSEGKLSTMIEGEYEGDHALIKDSLNMTINTLRDYVKEISYVLGEISKGNLNVEIKENYQGDFGEVKTSLENIITSLKYIITDINKSSVNLTEKSVELSKTSQIIKYSGDNQIEALDKLDITIGDVLKKAKTNKEFSEFVNNSIEGSNQKVILCNKKMDNLVESMERIEASSKNIIKIMKLIDGIALQTNILSINASIEAQKANVEGNGFIVVANEVGSLAMKVAEATKKTNKFIQESERDIKQGLSYAEETSNDLKLVLNEFKGSTDLVNKIKNSSKEQDINMESIKDEIGKVSKISKNNNEISEDNHLSSEKLLKQAEDLKHLVSKFNIENKSKDLEIVDSSL